MRYLEGVEFEKAKKYFNLCREIALSSSCFRARGGSVIINEGKILGLGFNSPPLDISLEKCLKEEINYEFKSDRTCCIHSEDRAVRDALKKRNELLESRIYYVRIDGEGQIVFAGKPYCTMCSKMVLDSGIAEFSLWHEKGIIVYDSFEYNEISFGRKEWIV